MQKKYPGTQKFDTRTAVKITLFWIEKKISRPFELRKLWSWEKFPFFSKYVSRKTNSIALQLFDDHFRDSKNQLRNFFVFCQQIHL